MVNFKNTKYLLILIITYRIFLIRESNNANIDSFFSDIYVFIEIFIIATTLLYSLIIIVFHLKNRFDKFERAILAYLLFFLVTILYSKDFVYALFHWLKLFSFVILNIYISKKINSVKDIPQFINIYFIASAIISIYIFYNILINFSTSFDLGGRLYFRWISPVWLGVLSGILVIVFLDRLIKSKLNLFTLGLLIISSLMLFFSGGRTGILATLIGVSSFFVFEKQTKYKVLFYSLLISISAYFVIIQFNIYSPWKATLRYIGNTESVTSLSGRVYLWSKIIDEIVEYPNYILGHGYTSSRRVGFETKIGWNASEPHNAFLAILYDGGIIALLLLISIILKLLFFLKKINRLINDKIFINASKARHIITTNTFKYILAILIYLIITGFSLSLYGSTLRFESSFFWYTLILGNTFHRILFQNNFHGYIRQM